MRKKRTPLLRDMPIQMEPITIMVRLRRAKIPAARFRSVGARWRTYRVQKEMEDQQGKMCEVM